MSTKDFLNKIINDDCVKVMQKFDNDSIDLVVTSPPYDGLRVYNGYEFNLDKITKELFRVIKQGGVVVWVISDATVNGSETGTSFKHALKFIESGFNLHDTMIFKKRNPIPQIYRRRYNNEFEYMFVFSKGLVSTHNPIRVDCLHAGLELSTTTYKNYSKGKQKREKLANPVKNTKIKGNIWEYVVGKNKEDQDAKGHPAPFPCKLAEDHILSWSNEGDVVLDPMSGSGTTCKMALQLGRKYIGIDVSEEYCNIAKQRLSHNEQSDSELRQLLELRRAEASRGELSTKSISEVSEDFIQSLI